VFERLGGGAKAVGELAVELPVSRPAVSQHLKVLKEAGLVIDRAEGTRRVYQIDPAGLGAIRAWLDRFWDNALAAFKAEIERTAPPPERPASGARGAKPPPKSRVRKPRNER
jgi:DNA-binding transcriptional ArsR family regulator